MALALVMRGLNQDEEKIAKWPLGKLMIYAKISADMEGIKFDG